jgi:translation initiation factor IF-2
MLENFKGERVQELYPSAPARVIGFEDLPAVGEKFQAGDINLTEIKLAAAGPAARAGGAPAAEGDKEAMKLVTKADTSGSLEALNHVIKEISGIRIVGSAVGDITDGDVDQAISTGSIIVGFRVKASGSTVNRAQIKNVKIISSEIIYKIVEEIEARLKELRGAIVAGELEILRVFETEGRRVVLGGRVVTGTIKVGVEARVERRGGAVATVRIINLQENRKDVAEVKEGTECGMLVESDAKIQPGDRIKIFSE